MGAVGAGEGVESGAENAVRQGHFLVLHEVGELKHLAAEEDTAEEDRAEEHRAGALHITLLDGVHRESHEERRHQQDERRERR